MQINPQTLFDSIPELFIVINSQGQYVSYFGGADADKYQDLDALTGKSLDDFLDSELAERIKTAISYAIEHRSPALVEYFIPEAGGLKNQHYRAELSPIKESDDAALMSVINITLEKSALDRAYTLTNLDPEISFPIMNRLSFDENRKEFKAMHPDVKETALMIEDFELIEMFCSKQKLLDLENFIVSGIEKEAAAYYRLVGRTKAGQYRLVVDTSLINLSNVVKRLSSSLAGKVVTARDGKTSFPIKLLSE